jgi:hypothetical protein
MATGHGSRWPGPQVVSHGILLGAFIGLQGGVLFLSCFIIVWLSGDLKGKAFSLSQLLFFWLQCGQQGVSQGLFSCEKGKTQKNNPHQFSASLYLV